MTSRSSMRSAPDHFEPEVHADPAAQRKVRGLLEAIDYMAFAANRDVLGPALGIVRHARVKRLAEATAFARARWLAEAFEITGHGGVPTAADASRLSSARQAYEEFAAAYEALRRGVERGYLTVAIERGEGQ